MAAMGDLHMQQDSAGIFREIFAKISKQADILLLCGDLTDNGLIDEAQLLGEELSFCKIPVVGVLGNHDHTNNQQEEIKKILSPYMVMLEDQPYIYNNIGFAGVKGFGGGFDNHLVLPFGEKILKQFVYEALNETTKLEEALTKLETDRKVVLLHYAPIRQTVEGESLEVYSLLGTSRLVEPIDNFKVNAVFHGHAHHGKAYGKTAQGVPVYNVSMPVLKKIQPNQLYIIVRI